jgi:hypothetical protein
MSTNDKIAIWGLNRPRKDNEVIVYTPEFGSVTKTNDAGVEIIVEDDMVVGISEGNSVIPGNGYVISFHGWTKDYANALPPGSPITTDIKLSEGWNEFKQVITGGPRLLDGGNNVARDNVEKESFGSEVWGRNARTAIGVTYGNKLILAVAEGKKFRSRRRRKLGVTYNELAEFLKSIGVKDAIGLDGGGSSTMFVNGRVVNAPLDGYQQRVSNAVIIKCGPNISLKEPVN